MRQRNGAVLVQQAGDVIYLAGDGASPKGDRPFLDRYNLKTGAIERIFQSEGESYETVVAVLADDGRSLLTRYETTKQPPNYLVRDLTTRSQRALTAFADPAPQLAGVERQFLTYARKDGVQLSATLYLPPGYKKGERLPLVMWAYPREFTDPALAGQVSGSPYRFTFYTGPSHMFFLTQGYAVLDNPTMPIVGAGETANDTYVDQLVSSAQAAIDKVVEMGVADRDRVGVGGHSYGAFMTANLLAHSRLFKAGIARSGAYNRTLTPFGFQAEQRTFWEVPQVYASMSPFWFADKVKDPILLIHGEADNNSGTFPIQSERFYMALKGHGATVRYVTLPNESHGYAGRESVLHTVYEMVSWFEKWVKGGRP
jgi:dipeptidyl aminopeptidase/acylaminoacyl peptidase